MTEVCPRRFENLAHSSPDVKGSSLPQPEEFLHQPHSKPSLPGTAFFMRRFCRESVRGAVNSSRETVYRIHSRLERGRSFDMAVRKFRSGLCFRIHFKNG